MGGGTSWRVWAPVAVLLMSGCSGSADNIASASNVPVPRGLEAGCPSPATQLRYASGDLPDGAVAVRLCPGQPTIAYTGDPTGPPIQAPRDELRVADDVSALVKLVNELPDAPADQACPLDDGPHHVYWFRYPDGDARAVAYNEAGCNLAVVGQDRARENGEELATAFADALAAQRAAASAPPRDDVSAPSCPPPVWSTPTSVLPVASIASGLVLAEARWCVVVGRNRIRSVDVPAELLGRVNGRLLVAPAEGRDRCKPAAWGSWLLGVTPWGDLVSYDVFGCQLVARTGFGRDHMTTTFETDPELLAALRDLPLGPVTRLDDK